MGELETCFRCNCVCRTASLVTDGDREELLGTFINQGLTGAMKSTAWKLAWGQFSLSASAVCVGSFRHVNANPELFSFLQKLQVQTLALLEYRGDGAELQNKKRMILIGLNLHGKLPC